jgi:hypothetical protein
VRAGRESERRFVFSSTAGRFLEATTALVCFLPSREALFLSLWPQPHVNTQMPDLIQQMEVRTAKTNLTRAAPRNNYRADKKMSYETDALRTQKASRWRFIWLPTPRKTNCSTLLGAGKLKVLR